MARFSPGDLVYHDYGEANMIVHERLVLQHVDGQDYTIATPDRDIYVETLDPGNSDLVGFYVGGANGALPPGLAGRNIYGFGGISARDYRQLLADGKTEAEAEKGRRGIAMPAPIAAAGGGDDSVWVLAEMVTGHRIGDEINLSPGAVTDGDWGLHHMTDADGKARIVLAARVKREELAGFCEERIQLCREAEASSGDDLLAAEDARTLAVRFGVNGERSRGFKESVQEMRIEEFSDFPFNPRTCSEYLKAISDVAESALSQHTMWVTQAGIPSGDRAIYEDDCLARILDYAVKFDGLNIVNLASFELLARRRQLIAEAHAHSPAAPSYEAADHFMQTGYRPGGAIVVPSLTKYVSEKLHQEGQILKERRKLREERGGRGRGRGQPGKNGAGQDAK